MISRRGKSENETPADSCLAQALAACRSGVVAVVLFSFCINILLLTGPLYMLQVFDRVIVSRSTDTLLFLSLAALVALLTLAGLELVRTKVMVTMSSWLEVELSGRMLTSSVDVSLQQAGNPSVQGLRDLSTIRNFLTGPGMFPILDVPWTPVFLAAVFLMQPALGWLALAGAVVLLSLAIVNELTTRGLLQRSGGAHIEALQQAECAVRNASVIEAMGMKSNLVRRWQENSDKAIKFQALASLRAGRIAALSKMIRQGLQMAVLGFGAWFVLLGDITPGVMIAASILMARALAPVDQAIGSWRSAVAARNAYQRVRQQLNETPESGGALPLPTPQGTLSVEATTFFYTGMTEPTLRAVSFRLEPGEAMGLIGPTAAGKTTLAGLMVGILKPRLGHVRLDGADVADWDSEDLGRHIGYLPQNIELFGGTVADNIARLGMAEADPVIAAAKLANVHDMILRLPAGYQTEIGAGGAALSGGQRQRIGLARALFGNPRFVMLDEPNAYLDGAGEEALVNALVALKANGTTVIVIAHRPSLLRHVDKILVLREGTVEAFGPKEKIMPTVTRPKAAAEPAYA